MIKMRYTTQNKLRVNKLMAVTIKSLKIFGIRPYFFKSTLRQYVIHKNRDHGLYNFELFAFDYLKCNFVFHCIILMELLTFVKHGKKPRHAQELDSGLYIFQIIPLKTS